MTLLPPLEDAREPDLPETFDFDGERAADLVLEVAEEADFRDFSLFDLRLSRRCTFLISSTSSSFFIPCQPETP